MKEPTPRELALGILLEVTAQKTYSHIAIRNVLEKYAYLDAKKRAQIRRLSSGTLEKLIRLDAVINLFSKVKTNKMKPVIRNILRMAVYEMLYMDAVPVASSVDEAVKLAERKGFRNLKGFVNGVLRSVAANLDHLELPDTLSIRYSMPEWIVDQWTSEYGSEKTEEILKGFETEASLTVHACETAMQEEELFSMWKEEGISSEETELPHAFRISGLDNLMRLPSFKKGGFFVQDLSSMKALSALPLSEDMNILDICGAPGGKSMFLSDALFRLRKDRDPLSENPIENPAEGAIVCRDLTGAKVAHIRENISRCKLSGCTAEVHDALLFDPEWSEKADAVIADLPCSGLGVLGRKPDIKLRQSEDGCRELSSIQKQILSVAADYVRIGGYLLFSTCTISRIENEDNVDIFLASHPDFVLLKSEQLFPIAGVQDGFFYALMQKKDG